MILTERSRENWYNQEVTASKIYREASVCACECKGASRLEHSAET